MEKANNELAQQVSALRNKEKLDPHDRSNKTPRRADVESAWRRLFSPEKDTYDARKFLWRPRSAFTFFVQDKLSCTSFPIDNTFGEEKVEEVKTLLKQWWRDTTPQEREKYNKMSAQDLLQAKKLCNTQPLTATQDGMCEFKARAY